MVKKKITSRWILKFLDLPSRRDRFCSLLHPYQAGSEGQNIRRVQISCKYREIRAWQIQNTNGLNLPSKQRHEHWCRSDCFVGRWKSQRQGLEPFCLKENCLDYFDVTFISSWFKSPHGSTHFQKQSLTILSRIFSYIWKAPWQKQYEFTFEG